jgi:hypothetical protein
MREVRQGSELQAVTRQALEGQVEVWRRTFGDYEVSSLGNIRRNGHMLFQEDRSGYRRVCLSINGKALRKSVHGLVALAFLGPRPQGWQVAHRNGKPHDNRLCNLAYKTRAENEADKVIHGTSLIGERNHQAKLRNSDIPAIRLRLAAGEALKSIAADFGVSFYLISKIKHGKAWAHAQPTT